MVLSEALDLFPEARPHLRSFLTEAHRSLANLEAQKQSIGQTVDKWIRRDPPHGLEYKCVGFKYELNVDREMKRLKYHIIDLELALGLRKRSKLDVQRAREVPLLEILPVKVTYGKACCPFHKEKTPSFKVFKDNHYHCFGCGAHGGPIDFVMQYYNLPFKQAVQKLTSYEF
jgi:hypothetical protein